MSDKYSLLVSICIFLEVNWPVLEITYSPLLDFLFIISPAGDFKSRLDYAFQN